MAVISREGQEENGEAVIVLDVWQRVYICYNTHVIHCLVPVCDNNSELVRIILSVISTSSSERPLHTLVGGTTLCLIW